MNGSKQIAKHFREIHFGGNWTCSNLMDVLSNISWVEANTQIDSMNSIATLVFHMNYFVSAVLKVLQGEKLEAHDKFSFDLSPIQSHKDWEILLDKTFTDAENFAALVEALPENKLWENFSEEKYGSYYRNLHGIIEHNHYHLGQIVMIKKFMSQKRD